MPESVTIGNLTFIYRDTALSITEEIHVADTVDFLTAQDLINACRQAEATTLGMGYPSVAAASGKNVLGVGVATGLTVELQSSWKIYTQKVSGVFTIGDGNIIKSDGSSPFVENAAVTYIQSLSAAATVVTSGGGGSGASAADVWSYSTRSLTDKSNFALSTAAIDAIASAVASALASSFAAISSAISSAVSTLSALITPKASQTSVDAAALKVSELHLINGLDAANPLTVSAVQRQAGTITQQR
jgi:hypothetical protein